MSLIENLSNVLVSAKNDLETINDMVSFANLKANYLGKKGPISLVMAGMRDLNPEERKEVGAKANVVKTELEAMFEEKKNELENKQIEEKLKSQKIDVTLPGYSFKKGTIHPLSQTIMDLEELFVGMGFEVKEGPEIETDEFCFEKLNLPKGHPARDMQDTFYITEELLLRSQTSPVQARTMLEKNGAPIKIVCPGKVYRRDNDDATHSHQFMQFEGLVLGPNITLGDLKGALLEMARKMLGESREIRLRPSFFPFTEPSVEVDVSCARCGGVGCPMCKGTGWIEVLGAGMVNNNVLRMSGYDPEKIQGYAFGIGVERICMLKYKIDNIRNFYFDDVRFLSQFKGEK